MWKLFALQLTLLTTTALSANLFLNPSFEVPVIGASTYTTLGSGDTFLTGWTVTGGCAASCVLVLRDSYTEGSLTFLPHSGNQSLDMTGSFNSLEGGISQTVLLTPGQQYRLGFYVGNQDNQSGAYPLGSSVDVLVNDVLLGTGTTSTSTQNALNWREHVFFFMPTVAANTFVFRNATPLADNMAGLDDVSLELAAAPVPEPATVTLTGAALLIAAMVRRRHSR